jgi:putative transferase (TIGR04331 family)
MWSASCIENGSKLFVSQHGGFGTALWNQTEAHQISICDIFYSWGWSRVDNLKVRPMPANKLNNIKKKITCSKNGKVLCVVNSDIVNYLHVQTPQAYNLDFKKYVSDLIKIVKNLDSDLGNIFKYRLYHTNYNRGVYGIKTEFERNNLHDYIDDKNDFYSSLCDSRLAIITYHPNATALETLAANFPTLLFWNPEVFEINQTSMPFFIELEKVGVFHTTIESLTGHLKDVYMDIDTWWFSTSVQRAVKMFCTEFALTSDNFVEAWTSELEVHL